MKIHELKWEVRSKLESGLIITDPVRCVLELVENSLDAAATAIAVRVNLNKYMIEVVDNGTGILPEDLNSVGKRFMTSKCCSINDLNKKLFTYGYRGQALASLIDVCSTLSIKTKSKMTKNTIIKVFRNKKSLPVFISSREKSGTGTTVTVVEFMSSMPVRRKRISAVFDLPEIKRQLEYLALIHNQVCFTLRDEKKGEIILQTHKTMDCTSSFTNLFGLGLDTFLVPFNCIQRDIEIRGYICLKRHFENNLQFVYVNKRIISKGVLHKILNNLINNYVRENYNVDNESPVLEGVNWNVSNDLHNMYVVQIQCPYAFFEIFRNGRKTTVEFNNWDHVLKCIKTAFKSVFGKKRHDIEMARISPKQNVLINKWDHEYLKNGIRGVPVKRKSSEKIYSKVSLKRNDLTEASNFPVKNKSPQEINIIKKGNLRGGKVQIAENSMDYSLSKRIRSEKVVPESPTPAQHSWNFSRNFKHLNLNCLNFAAGERSKLTRFTSLDCLYDFAVWFESKVKSDFNALKIYNEFIEFRRNSYHFPKCGRSESVLGDPRAVMINRSEENGREPCATVAKCKARHKDTWSGKKRKGGALILEDKSERIGKRCICPVKEGNDENITAPNSFREEEKLQNNLKTNKRRKMELSRDKLTAKKLGKCADAGGDENILLGINDVTKGTECIKNGPPFEVEMIEKAEKAFALADKGESKSFFDVDIATKSWSSHYRHCTESPRKIFCLNGKSTAESSGPDVNENKKMTFFPKQNNEGENPKCRVSLFRLNSDKDLSFHNSFKNPKSPGVCEDTETRTSFATDKRIKEVPTVTVSSPIDKLNARFLPSDKDFGCCRRECENEADVKSAALLNRNGPVSDLNVGNGLQMKFKKTVCGKGTSTNSCSLTHSASNVRSGCDMKLQQSEGRDKLVECDNLRGSRCVKSGLSPSDNIISRGTSKSCSIPLTSTDKVSFLGISVTDPLMNPQFSVCGSPLKSTYTKNGQIITSGNIAKRRSDELFTCDLPDTHSVQDEMNVSAASFIFTERYNFIPKGLSQTVLDKSPFHLNKRNKYELNMAEEKFNIFNSDEGEFNMEYKSDGYLTSLIPYNFVQDLRQKAKENMIHYESELLTSSMTKSSSEIDNLLKSFVMDKTVLSNFKIVGQWDKKFVLAVIVISFPEKMKLLTIFDQHAADERIRIEKLLKESRDNSGKFVCCPCNPPIRCKLNGSLVAFVPALENVLVNYGVKVSIVDSETILLHEVPICVFDENLKNEKTENIVRDLIRDIVEEFSETRGTTAGIPKVLYNLLSTKACKSAVKFNKTLSAGSMKKMIEDLVSCQTPFLCAHGRPSIVPVIDLEAFENQVKREPKLKFSKFAKNQ